MKKYNRPRKPVSQKDVDRFWSKVDVGSATECWGWNLTATRDGYGLFSAGGTLHRCTRFAYVHRGGVINSNNIQRGLRISTTCGNKMCCNPSHMKTFSHQEIWDNMAKNNRITVGSKHKMAKLKESDILQMRARYVYRSATDGFAAIGRDYGVTTGCVRDICIRKTWRHV